MLVLQLIIHYPDMDGILTACASCIVNGTFEAPEIQEHIRQIHGIRVLSDLVNSRSAENNVKVLKLACGALGNTVHGHAGSIQVATSLVGRTLMSRLQDNIGSDSAALEAILSCIGIFTLDDTSTLALMSCGLVELLARVAREMKHQRVDSLQRICADVESNVAIIQERGVPELHNESQSMMAFLSAAKVNESPMVLTAIFDALERVCDMGSNPEEICARAVKAGAIGVSVDTLNKFSGSPALVRQVVSFLSIIVERFSASTQSMLQQGVMQAISAALKGKRSLLMKDAQCSTKEVSDAVEKSLFLLQCIALESKLASRGMAAVGIPGVAAAIFSTRGMAETVVLGALRLVQTLALDDNVSHQVGLATVEMLVRAINIFHHSTNVLKVALELLGRACL